MFGYAGVFGTGWLYCRDQDRWRLVGYIDIAGLADTPGCSSWDMCRRWLCSIDTFSSYNRRNL